MKLLNELENNFSFSEGSVVTIGNFDGVHRGHQAVLSQLREQAERRCLPSVLLLFEPQPNEYFHGPQAPTRITSLREKIQILQQYHVDYVYCLRFNKRLSLMSAEEFAKHYFFSLFNVNYLLVGEDFRFGCGRKGDVFLLKQISKQSNCQVDVFPNFSIENQRVSSTKIRALLLNSQFKQVAYLLGRDYSLCGRVIRGDGRGRQWGIPTANLYRQHLGLSLKGVFCVRVQRKTGESYLGVANLGTRPTIDGTKNTFEVHLFDLNETIYGEWLHVFFLHKLRNEIKFSSINELIAQIHDDIAAAKIYFNRPSVVESSGR